MNGFKKRFKFQNFQARFHLLVYCIILLIVIFIAIFNALACIKLINSDLPNWLKFLILFKS